MSIQNKYNRLKLRSTKDLSEAHVRITELEKQSDTLQAEIEDLQNNSGGGDFIPLTGTEEGSPVTRDIEIKSGYGFLFDDTDDSGVKIRLIQEAGAIQIVNVTDQISVLKFHSFGGIELNGSYPINGTSDFSDIDTENKYIFAQRAYVDKANSYSTTETLTGGTWIDGKPIYRLVKLTIDPDPSDIETRLPDIIVGSYSILQYTKTID